jgi:hypothetical protein
MMQKTKNTTAPLLGSTQLWADDGVIRGRRGGAGSDDLGVGRRHERSGQRSKVGQRQVLQVRGVALELCRCGRSSRGGGAGWPGGRDGSRSCGRRLAERTRGMAKRCGQARDMLDAPRMRVLLAFKAERDQASASRHRAGAMGVSFGGLSRPVRTAIRRPAAARAWPLGWARWRAPGHAARRRLRSCASGDRLARSTQRWRPPSASSFIRIPPPPSSSPSASSVIPSPCCPCVLMRTCAGAVVSGRPGESCSDSARSRAASPAARAPPPSVRASSHMAMGGLLVVAAPARSSVLRAKEKKKMEFASCLHAIRTMLL